MKKKEVDNHSGCPYRGHCTKDETKCCYLLSNRNCYLNTRDSEVFL